MTDNITEQKFKLLQQILNEASKEIESAQDEESLDKIRVRYLGKKGELTEILKLIGQLPTKEEKVKLGEAVNVAKGQLQELLKTKTDQFLQQKLSEKLSSETIDVTLPGRKQSRGTLHPVMQVRDRIIEIFSGMGFDVADGPEIETEFYNFEALNIPSTHPARAEQDTFFLANDFSDKQKRLLRTHTSPVQIRYMQSHQPPMRVIAPGKVYRPDFDVTHTPMFHQMEALVIDKTVTLGHLKALIAEFIRQFFDQDFKIRFRASYFPFTEPSAEVDICCAACKGKGCRVCGSGWIEVLGCGIVHSNVLRAGNIDPQKYRGYAVGFGIDRLAMLYFGIHDTRSLFENDLRLLQQF